MTTDKRDEIIVVRLPKINKTYPRLGVLLIVASISALLFFLAPAEAFTLSLNATNPNVTRGEVIRFSASINIDQNEMLLPDYLILNLSNSNLSTACKFYSNGTIISGCSGIHIVRVSSSDYGYGYGYSMGYGYGYGYGFGKGALRYNITLDTTNYTSGTYDTRLSVISQYANVTQKGNKVTIAPKTTHNQGGSKTIKNACYLREGLSIYNKNIRGDSGVLSVFGSSFVSKNQLKLSVPSQKARPGSGSLTAQQGKGRFSYSFKITKIEDGANTAKIYVSGKYRLGVGKQTLLNATITIDKLSSTATMTGDNFNFEDINIIFNGRDC